VAGMITIAGMLGSVVLGAASDRVRRRKPFLVMAGLAAAPTLWLLGHLGSLGPLVAVAFTLGFFLLAALPIAIAVASEDSSLGPQVGSTAVGVMLLAGNLGGAAVVIGMGALKSTSGDFRAAVALIASLALVVALIALTVPDPSANPGVGDRTRSVRGPVARAPLPRRFSLAVRLAPLALRNGIEDGLISGQITDGAPRGRRRIATVQAATATPPPISPPIRPNSSVASTSTSRPATAEAIGAAGRAATAAASAGSVCWPIAYSTAVAELRLDDATALAWRCRAIVYSVALAELVWDGSTASQRSCPVIPNSAAFAEPVWIDLVTPAHADPAIVADGGAALTANVVVVASARPRVRAASARCVRLMGTLLCEFPHKQL
jgi:Major Facilitator Superfamily